MWFLSSKTTIKPVTFFCCLYCETSARIAEKPSDVATNFEQLAHKYSAFNVNMFCLLESVMYCISEILSAKTTAAICYINWRPNSKAYLDPETSKTLFSQKKLHQRYLRGFYLHPWNWQQTLIELFIDEIIKIDSMLCFFQDCGFIV